MGTYSVERLVDDELITELDVFLEHEWVFDTVDDLEEELLPLQEGLVGDFDFVGFVVAGGSHKADAGYEDQSQFHCGTSLACNANTRRLLLV